MSTSESARARPVAWEPKSQAASTLGCFLKTSSAICREALLSTVSENLVSEAVEALEMIVCDVHQNIWVDAVVAMHDQVSKPNHLSVEVNSAQDAQGHAILDGFSARCRRCLARKGEDSMTDIQHDLNTYLQAALDSTPDNPFGGQTLRRELPQ